MGLKDWFGWGSKKPNNKPDVSITPEGEIGDDFIPKEGVFFQTLEYPITGQDNETVIGKTWMEAGLNPETNKWVLWQKTVRDMNDVLRGGDTTTVRKSQVLLEDTTFKNAYAQMITFEESQKSLETAPLKQKTPAKLSGDYFRQFAWREQLVASRSGRLYPVSEDRLNASNFFNEQELIDAKAFLDRHNKEKFVAVPIVLPCTDWEKAYNADKERVDQRLRALYARFDQDKNSYKLALQIVKNEAPEVLYAHLKEGFNPKTFEDNAEQHYGLLKAAIERTSVEPLSLLSEAGLSFFVRYDEETPVERALREKRYSHLKIMISRDGVKLVNYADETGISPAIQAIEGKDNQAFRMLYVEGIDFSHADDNGWYVVHHAFKHNFMRGIYAWLDDELPIDYKINGTDFTGVSIAKKEGHYTLLSFAEEKGADMSVEALPAQTQPDTTVTADQTDEAAAEEIVIPDFTLELLDTDTSNDIILKAAETFVESGGDLNTLNEAGLSVFEICWKNTKTSQPELDRRQLIETFGKMGADSSATLPDGSTALTREAKSPDLDMDFITTVAPYAKDVNNADAEGNNIMHAIQLNANDQVGHSRNIKAILTLFPKLDLNQQNNDGYSNIGLAIRLNRSNTLKAFTRTDTVADFSKMTKAGWSYLDLAFTAAFGEEKGRDFPLWANKIDEISDKVQNSVLGMVNQVMINGDDGQQQSLYDALNRQRPDGQTLAQAMIKEQVSDQTVMRLVACGMQKPQGGQQHGMKP